MPPRHALCKRTPQAGRRRWDIGITALQAYAAEHGHADPPATHRAPDGYRLGGWLAGRREEYRSATLTDKQEKQLRDLGVTLDPGSNKGPSWQAHEQQQWNDWIRLLAEYQRKHGDVHVACSYHTPDGRALGMWLSNCRRKYREGRLREHRMTELSALGVDFDTNGRGSLDARFAGWVRALIEYHDEHGHMPPGTYRTPDGRPLGNGSPGAAPTTAKADSPPNEHSSCGRSESRSTDRHSIRSVTLGLRPPNSRRCRRPDHSG
ncbi:helicase associated domain-containing protein [Nocardia carnea]|uniref:Helicase associated domain-containing protein n=1 Tax=Nocardia carnea TaxID=37328 RepID=A0ABW7TYD1_9NOCA|nr:helicase associated domain-containing protein [Nocardia carnea]